MNTNLDRFYDCTIRDAKILPRGWVWIQYDDGSGHLESPDGKESFSYDLTVYPNAVEWKLSKNHAWDIFFGTFDEFKEFAETTIKKAKEEEEEMTETMRIIRDLRNKRSRDNRSLFDRAADEIERLQKEIEELKNK